MKMVHVEPEDIPRAKYRGRGDKNKIRNLLETFRDSEFRAVLIDTEPGEYTEASSVQVVLTRAIRTYGMSNMKCIIRDGRAYLIKEGACDG